MRYYVVTGGPLTDKASEVIGEGKVIAADRGIDFCLKHGIKPYLALGDMDSVSKEGLEAIKKTGIEIKTYPVEKDFTDTEIALSFVPENEGITVVCPLNGRLDHVIANLQIASSLHTEGRDIRLDDGLTEVYFLSGSETVTIGTGRWGNDSAVSVVPLTHEVKGVTLKGLYYPLEDGCIETGRSLSFSNRPAEGVREFSVTIKEGRAAVIVTRAV